jgi:RimJ/RimL family protein N-acetyltransferase
MAIDEPGSAQAAARDLLLGEQVRLRPLEEGDLVHLEGWWNDPEWQVLQQPVVRPRPDGPAREQFRRWSANDSSGSAGFSVETRASGELVGHITLWGASLPARSAVLAVIIGPAHVGRGLGTDAVRVMCRYGFRSMGLHRIGLEVASFNPRGRRAYEKAGFQVEGVRRESVYVDGGFRDEVLMGLLRRDWEALEGARHVAEVSA